MTWILLLSSMSFAAAEPQPLPYDPSSATWKFDEAGLVSRNDVLYATPSVEPWEAMPVGGGDLSAMVRCDGENLHLHLTKSDAWGYQAPPDALLGTRFFNNVSPGHFRIAFGSQAKALAAQRFRQRLDLYRGRILITLGEGNNAMRLAIWGHPERDVLIVEVTDPPAQSDPFTIELSEWRDTMSVDADAAGLVAWEVHTRPAGPHMATSGMENHFNEETDPLLNRVTAVAVSVPGVEPAAVRVEASTATIALPGARPTNFHMIIACTVSPKAGSEPLDDVRRELDGACETPLAQFKAEHEAWWREYWSKSFLRLDSPDGMAQWLTASYYVHLYTLGCTNRGPVPAKWDGGAGLMRGDERTWGLAEWVQEIRFTYLPLYAANRLDMTKGLTDHYTRMRPFLLEQTKKMWDVPGLWIPETVLPWGGVEDWALRATDAHSPGFKHWDPASAPYGQFERYNPYVGFLFACGPELCWHYLAYYRFSGDEDYLADEAYPVVREVARFLSHLLRKGDDGRYHLESANALETWWKVRDPADAMDGIRWLFAEFIQLSEQFQKDGDLRARCQEQLKALPDPSLGLWHQGGTVDTSIDAYAAAAALGDPVKHCNFENPALYRVFPFGLTGIGSDDHARAMRTFEKRIFSAAQSWSMDAIWAARLGLRDQACDLLAIHTKKWNRFRYGGWDSGNSSVFPGNLAVVPYLDGAGVACYALNEILLQSHGGIIRILPAMAEDWSGAFQLRAEGGFLVGVDFQDGVPRFVEIRSLNGGPCVMANPWGRACIVRSQAKAVLESDEPILRFPTDPGAVYAIEPRDAPVSTYRPTQVNDTPNGFPGMPGRDD
jgi:alpha-L-fucosidase 2